MTDTVVVTGGFGYLGGRIANRIQKDTDWQVRLTDLAPHSPPDWLPQAQTEVLDVLDPKTFTASLKGVRAIVHLAAINEVECASDPEKALAVNTLGTLKLVRAAIDSGVERFIYFSTAHIYGAPLTGEISELRLPRPVHPYAITHHGAEEYVLAAHDQGRMTGIVVRLSNGFGAPTHTEVDRWMLLVNDLCRQAVQTKQLTLRSSGLPLRDFITVHDVGRGVCHLLNLPRHRCGDGVFNLGGECPMSVIDMARQVADRCKAVLGFEPPIVRPEPAPGESVPSLHYSMDKLKQTGFALQGSIDMEIDATLKLCEKSFKK